MRPPAAARSTHNEPHNNSPSSQNHSAGSNTLSSHLCRYDGSAMFHTSECDVGYYYHNGNIMIGFYRVENTVI